MFTFSRIPAPLGDLLAVTAADGTLHALEYADFEPRLHRLFGRHHPGASLTPGAPPPALVGALGAYFAGSVGALGAVCAAGIGSAFQQRVWAALRLIPAGQTRSYGQIAAAIGQPTASRAIGLANGANPCQLVVPCHRVIGSAGTLVGYAGGVDRKAWLLRHEGALEN